MVLTDDELARRVTRAELAKRAFIVFTAVVVTISLAVLLTLAVQGRQRGRESRELLTKINSCTQPSGECYKRGQKQAGEAVSNINNVVILAAACSAGLPAGLSVPERQTRIQSCVIQRLAAHSHHAR